jgi:hypothetical protein
VFLVLKELLVLKEHREHKELLAHRARLDFKVL